MGEIIEDVQSAANQASIEELRYTIVVMDALTTFDRRDIRSHTPVDIRSRIWWRWKQAWSRCPQDFVGWNNDPANPAYQERRRASLALLEKIKHESKPAQAEE